MESCEPEAPNAFGRRRLFSMAGTPPNVCMFGTGEYTTGFTGQGASTSDKSTGVVALVMLDLRLRGMIGRLGMCGVHGPKLPAVHAHMASGPGRVRGHQSQLHRDVASGRCGGSDAYRQARRAHSTQ
jgi:D-galacturonate reductase